MLGFTGVIKVRQGIRTLGQLVLGKHWLGSFGVVQPGAREVAQLGAVLTKVLLHALVKLALGLPAVCKRHIPASVVNALKVLGELAVAALLHLAEELESTSSDLFTLGQALARVWLFLAAQHIFLAWCIAVFSKVMSSCTKCCR